MAATDEKHVYDWVADHPIPSYEEATSSRLGFNQASEDAERQGLLGHHLASGSNSRRRNSCYQPPSVESARSSLDGVVDADEGQTMEDTAMLGPELRQAMEEMDILDPDAADDGRRRNNGSRGRFSKRFYSITHTLSGLHLPRIPWPTLGWAWRLPTIPDDYRPSWAMLARLCGLILIIMLVYMLIVSEIVPIGGSTVGAPFSPEWARQTAIQSIEQARIEHHLRYISSYDHVAGTEGSYVLGQYIEGNFKESHMDIYTHDEYFAYLNYPLQDGRRVAIVHPPEKAWEAELEEGSAYDPGRPQTKTFHGLSASGNVTGPLIYVNYGHQKDFEAIKARQIDVKGAVVLVKYYGAQSDKAIKVKTAHDAGAVGVIMFSDPADDGFIKGDVWPNGRWRPEDGVQRGSVALTNMIVGDVLTPGRPSTVDEERMPKDKNLALPHIPSIPISWKNAQKLLQSLDGIGHELSDGWVGGSPNTRVKWWSGHPDKSPKVNLKNMQDEVDKQRITNVFGSFFGTEERTKKIIVGNHRDSWCFGAAGPGSGTAVMLEVARVLGQLRVQGWQPLRTIEFASWDAAEYNMIGSTEHVEANLEELRANAIAYLNVDVGITGDKLWANGAPIFAHVWTRALNLLMDPLQNKTLIELWNKSNGKLGGLAADSDYVAFQDLAGCSSLDFGFAGPAHGDLAHSCYQTFEWVSQHIDPGFVYHQLLAQIWVLIILELAQEPIMPLKLSDYATSLQSSTQALIEWTKSKDMKLDLAIFDPLIDAVRGFAKQAKAFSAWEEFWYNSVYGTGGFETAGLTSQRIAHNRKLAAFDKDLLDLPSAGDGEHQAPYGLPGREQFKHVVFGPDPGYFPFVRDAVEKGDGEAVSVQIRKTAEILQRASDRLAP